MSDIYIFFPVFRLSPTPSLQTTLTPWNNWLKSCSTWETNWLKFLEVHLCPPRTESTSRRTTTWTRTPAMAPSSSELQELRARLCPDRLPPWLPPAARTSRALHTRRPRKTKAAAKSTPFCSDTLQRHREARQRRCPAAPEAKLPGAPGVRVLPEVWCTNQAPQGRGQSEKPAKEPLTPLLIRWPTFELFCVCSISLRNSRIFSATMRTGMMGWRRPPWRATASSFPVLRWLLWPVGPHAHFIQLAFLSVSCNDLCRFCIVERKGGSRFVWSSRRCGQWREGGI